ncbi:MAG: hypothetical protein AAF713_03985 [Pseudomonadota bacterium]
MRLKASTLLFAAACLSVACAKQTEEDLIARGTLLDKTYRGSVESAAPCLGERLAARGWTPVTDAGPVQAEIRVTTKALGIDDELQIFRMEPAEDDRSFRTRVYGDWIVSLTTMIDVLESCSDER